MGGVGRQWEEGAEGREVRSEQHVLSPGSWAQHSGQVRSDGRGEGRCRARLGLQATDHALRVQLRRGQEGGRGCGECGQEGGERCGGAGGRRSEHGRGAGGGSRGDGVGTGRGGAGAASPTCSRARGCTRACRCTCRGTCTGGSSTCSEGPRAGSSEAGRAPACRAKARGPEARGAQTRTTREPPGTTGGP